MIDADQKVVKIGLVNGAHIGDMFLGGNPLLIGFEHNCGAMSIVAANVVTFVASHLLKAHPDVGLRILQDVSKMECCIGVWKGAGNKNLTSLWHGDRFFLSGDKICWQL